MRNSSRSGTTYNRLVTVSLLGCLSLLTACTQNSQPAPAPPPPTQTGANFSTMTAQQAKAAIVYIKHDPNIPPQAKTMELSALKNRLSELKK